jgi:hypothetical protein
MDKALSKQGILFAVSKDVWHSELVAQYLYVAVEATHTDAPFKLGVRATTARHSQRSR